VLRFREVVDGRFSRGGFSRVIREEVDAAGVVQGLSVTVAVPATSDSYKAVFLLWWDRP